MRLQYTLFDSRCQIAGCAFHPRCPFYEEGVCDDDLPALTRVPGFNQQVACIPLQLGREQVANHVLEPAQG